MKILNNILKAFFAALLFVAIATGCRQSADLNIDPISRDTLFTFTPSHGAEGQIVQIQGTDLSDVLQVAIGDKECDITSQSATSISIAVPVNALSAKIKLIKENRVLTSLTNFVVDEKAVPTIIDFTPAIVGSGKIVTITGNLLNEVDSVYIGDLKAEIQPGATASSIQIMTPVGLQTAKITMYYDYLTNYGLWKVASSVSDLELTLKLPTIESITPDISALDIGDVLTFTGTMFSELDTIYFGEVGATEYTIKSDTEMDVTVPAGATKGKIILVVPDGQTESDDDFNINLPTIASFTPSKGDEDPGNPRNFAVQGTNLSLVNEVYLGTALATITDQTNNILLFTVDGAASGSIELHTDNGVVTSDVPFLITGDFWVIDFDNIYTPSRFGNFSNNNLGSFANATVDDGSGSNNCEEFTISGNVNNSSFYLFSPRVTSDGFILYTPSPEGVYLEFDMRVTAIDDTCKQDNGTLKFKVYSMDSQSWGAALPYTYGANGPVSYVQTDGQWQHFRMHLNDFNAASGNGGLYNVEQLAATDGAQVFPNSLRILAFVFGTPNESGTADNIVMAMDNIKFVIE